PARGRPVPAADTLAGPKELLHRVPPQRDNQPGLQREDLPIQIAVAGGLLLGERVAVARWPALDDVRNEDLRALPADALQQLLEELSGWTDERPARLVLPAPGPFAHEQHFGVRRPFARHRTRAREGQLTAGAGEHLGPHRLQIEREAGRLTGWQHRIP